MSIETYFSPKMTFDQSNEPLCVLAIIAHRERGLALQRLLSLSGYNIVLAADAHEAIQLANANQIALLLLDNHLPILGPLATLALLRQATLCQAPVIVLDTLPDEAARAEWQARDIAYVPTLPNSAVLEALLASYTKPSTTSTSRRAPRLAKVLRAALSSLSASLSAPAARKARPSASLLRAAS
jgi:CheY-like chemotaxis protein